MVLEQELSESATGSDTYETVLEIDQDMVAYLFAETSTNIIGKEKLKKIEYDSFDVLLKQVIYFLMTLLTILLFSTYLVATEVGYQNTFKRKSHL